MSNLCIRIDERLESARIGIAQIEAIHRWQAHPAFEKWFADQLEIAKDRVSDSTWNARRESVREMLRTAHFKPTGRSKPAQEYLLRCLLEPPFPRVNIPVDCLNLFSVTHGIPISLLRRDRFLDSVNIRLGRESEQYVFNRAGQALDLHGLLCVCGGLSADQPLGSPVKDSMEGKVDDPSQDMIAFLYGPSKYFQQSELDDMAQELSDRIRSWGD